MLSYLLLRKEDKVWSWLIDRENMKAVEVHVDDMKPQKLQIGDIVTARVSDIRYSIGGAFLDIPGPEGRAYLSLEDVDSPVYLKKGRKRQLQPSDELIVQVKREAMKSKDLSVTTKLSLRGRYCIVDHCSGAVGVSRKLPSQQRERLKNLGDALLPQISGMNRGQFSFGILLRTNASASTDEEIRVEAVSLAGQLQELIRAGIHRSVPCVLYRHSAAWLERLRSLPDEEDLKIMTDDRALYAEAETFLQKEAPQLAVHLTWYDDPMLSLPRLYSVEKQTADATSKIVCLKDGGFLVMEPTEALTAIDVNTGRNAPKGTKKDKDSVALGTNLLAAREVARQIRLRNLSGIIIVDFINMEDAACRAALISELKKALLQDPLRPSFIDITPLGLAEITRRKVERPLHEQIRDSVKTCVAD